MIRCFILILLLTGCAHSSRRTVYLGGGSFIKLPSPAEIKLPKKAVQVLKVRHDKAVRTFESIIGNSGSEITLAILSPMWPTPFILKYDGREITSSSATAQWPFDPKYILADMLLVYASPPVIRSHLNASSQLKETSLQREIIDVSQNAPRVVTDIRYENVNPFGGLIRLRNLTRGYEIEIKTLKVEL